MECSGDGVGNGPVRVRHAQQLAACASRVQGLCRNKRRLRWLGGDWRREAAVAGLVADNLVCDERFAEALIAVRIRKGQGPVRIRRELKKRGVNSDTIRLHLDDAGHDWKGLALEVRQRKYGGALPDEYKEKARQMRFLEYRGFSSEHIRAALGDDFD